MRGNGLTPEGLNTSSEVYKTKPRGTASAGRSLCTLGLGALGSSVRLTLLDICRGRIPSAAAKLHTKHPMIQRCASRRMMHGSEHGARSRMPSNSLTPESLDTSETYKTKLRGTASSSRLLRGAWLTSVQLCTCMIVYAPPSRSTSLLVAKKSRHASAGSTAPHHSSITARSMHGL